MSRRQEFIKELPEVFGCKPTQEDCVFSRCLEWGRCANLNDAILAREREQIEKIIDPLRRIAGSHTHGDYEINPLDGIIESITTADEILKG